MIYNLADFLSFAWRCLHFGSNIVLNFIDDPWYKQKCLLDLAAKVINWLYCKEQLTKLEDNTYDCCNSVSNLPV